MAQPSDYYLTDDQVRTLFEQEVRPFVFGGYSPQARPVLSLFGAQQGAGKSQAIAARRQEPDGADLVALGPDDLRPLHPRYAEVLAEYPLLMKDATAQATTAWVAMCHDYARQHSYGLILEGTFKDPQDLLGVAAAYASHGYTVEMTALAVRRERSSLDILNRHLPTHDAAPGRWVYPDRHDNAYRMIPLAVTAAEAAPQIHRITVTNRAGENLYTNTRTAGGAWQHEPAGAAAVEAERARPFSPPEASGWLRLCHQVAVNFTAAGHLNDTTLDALHRVLDDAQQVGRMAAWTDGDRARHAEVERLVTTMHTTDPWSVGTSRALLTALGELEQTDLGTDGEPMRRIGDLAAERLHPSVRQYSAPAPQTSRPPSTSAVDPQEVEGYRLPERENERIFYERIVPALLEGRTSLEQPTTVFIIGQPGSGKSRVTELVAVDLDARGGFADIDSDLYKPYHPQYAALLAQDDTLMAAYTRADGRAWMARAEEYVRTHRLNAIVQETSQNANAVADKLRTYRQAGARIEALLMGVPKALSDQGIVNRYFEQLADRGQGRLTVQANADESYLGILALADLTEQSVLVDQVSVYRRGESQPRYLNTRTEQGAWDRPTGLRLALETERDRPLAPSESSAFVTTQLHLRQVSASLNASHWPDRLARIEQHALPLLTPADRQRLVDAQRLAASARPSSAAARSRSTTVRQSPPKRGPDAGAKQQPPPRPEGPEAGHGRSR